MLFFIFVYISQVKHQIFVTVVQYSQDLWSTRNKHNVKQQVVIL